MNLNSNYLALELVFSHWIRLVKCKRNVSRFWELTVCWAIVAIVLSWAPVFERGITLLLYSSSSLFLIVSYFRFRWLHLIHPLSAIVACKRIVAKRIAILLKRIRIPTVRPRFPFNVLLCYVLGIQTFSDLLGVSIITSPFPVEKQHLFIRNRWKLISPQFLLNKYSLNSP